MGIAGDRARQVAALRLEDLPPQAPYWSMVALLDALGVALAGSGEEAPQLVEAALEAGDGFSLLLSHAVNYRHTEHGWHPTSADVEISVSLTGGAVLATTGSCPRGRTSANPIPLEDPESKFGNCAQRVLTSRAAAAAEAVASFEQCGSVRDFMRLLEPEAGATVLRAGSGC